MGAFEISHVGKRLLLALAMENPTRVLTATQVLILIGDDGEPWPEDRSLDAMQQRVQCAVVSLTLLLRMLARLTRETLLTWWAMREQPWASIETTMSWRRSCA